MLFTRIYIGTSGWDYEDWVGPFYERETNLFSQYVRVFSTAEVNSTFYTLPTGKFMEKLFRVAPSGFVFSLKMYRGVTHKKLLNPKAVEQELDLFFKSLEPVRGTGKLGAILIQLPPVDTKEIPWFRDFLELLPKGYRYAVEFRDRSWLNENTFKILTELNIAYTIVDEPLLPPDLVVTSDFAYVRWHGRGERPWYYYHYTPEELREWAPRIQRLAEQVKLVLGYFNNHFRGFAPHNALQMLAFLGMLDREKRQVLKRMDEYFSSVPGDKLLEAKKAVISGDVEGILRALAGEKRFARGLEISDRDVSVEVLGDSIVGRVKEYVIEVNMRDRRIYHNCEDWRKQLESKRFCKHMVKFFLKVPRDTALKVLDDIVSSIDEWGFEADTSGEGERANSPPT
ncbi:DUF72 domain-containing protein [Infirmifilum lucidum]|uniref:DUF72 domain-containing protein n=1 Tax=Infirmifilum lucidum TaxID=2776706 RepID=A0A7L9FFL3_9CREN|nr:DUF72 domain-containing protein [Infirmifilum lucidum]QOJ78467.1 DUF72 domain-containing protein [Infirmifilum lucidum]